MRITQFKKKWTGKWKIARTYNFTNEVILTVEFKVQSPKYLNRIRD